MKKAFRYLICTGMVLLFAAQVNAQNTGTASAGKDGKQVATGTTATRGSFTDKNNNGICDNHESVTSAGKGQCVPANCGAGKCGNPQKVLKSGAGKGCCPQGTVKCAGQGNGCGNGKSLAPGKGCANPCPKVETK